MADEQRRRPGVGEGIRAGLGILTAFKEAIEDTFQEVVDRGDMKPDRARQAIQDAMQRAQSAFDELRERVDSAPRRELEALRAEVEELRQRVSALEDRGERGAGPDASGIIIEPA
jgi:polyhydroxyalkanoate synthesis regulator phasin